MSLNLISNILKQEEDVPSFIESFKDDIKLFAYDICINQEQGHQLEQMSEKISYFLKNTEYSRLSTPTNYSNLDNTTHNDFVFVFGQNSTKKNDIINPLNDSSLL